MKWELLHVQSGFQRGRWTRDQIASFHWIREKVRQFQKNIYSCFIDYPKTFDCVYHNKLWKILKEMGTPDHLTCLLRNVCGGQKGTVRTGHETTDWFHIGKGVLSPCLFNRDESQAGIKIAGNINKLRYADESESVTQLCPTFCNFMDSSLQIPLSMEFSRQEYWSG